MNHCFLAYLSLTVSGTWVVVSAHRTPDEDTHNRESSSAMESAHHDAQTDQDDYTPETRAIKIRSFIDMSSEPF